MEEQIKTLTVVAESTITRLEHIAAIRHSEGRDLSVCRRKELVVVRDLLSRIDQLIWRLTNDRKSDKQSYPSVIREL